jgi:hypothetical protein
MYHDQIYERVRKLGMSGAAFASVANISAPKLSNFFKGRLELPAGKAKELDQPLRDIAALQQRFPIPLEMHDAKWLKLALERFRSGSFETFHNLTKEFANPEVKQTVLELEWSKTLSEFAESAVQIK